MIGWADQSGLGLRGESYYTKQDPASVELREKYVDHIARVFGLLGTDAATASAQASAVMAIETRLASASLYAEFREAHFDFYSATLSGVKEKSPRWRHMVSMTDSYLGEAVGIKFVEKNFTPEAKAKALEMVHNVMDVMREQIANREWMGPETKKEALASLWG